jgi:hypothetical protein
MAEAGYLDRHSALPALDGVVYDLTEKGGAAVRK